MDHFFKYYWSLLDKIIQANIELKYMKEDLYNINGIKFDDMPKGGKKTDIVDQMHNIVEKEKEIKMLIDKKNEYRRLYETKIDKLSNSKYSMVLTLYYLDRITLKEIAHILKISVGHVKKIKRIASNEFMSNDVANSLINNSFNHLETK